MGKKKQSADFLHLCMIDWMKVFHSADTPSHKDTPAMGTSPAKDAEESGCKDWITTRYDDDIMSELEAEVKMEGRIRMRMEPWRKAERRGGVKQGGVMDGRKREALDVSLWQLIDGERIANHLVNKSLQMSRRH